MIAKAGAVILDQLGISYYGANPQRKGDIFAQLPCDAVCCSQGSTGLEYIK